jgi:hypothetical protein
MNVGNRIVNSISHISSCSRCPVIIGHHFVKLLEQEIILQHIGMIFEKLYEIFCSLKHGNEATFMSPILYCILCCMFILEGKHSSGKMPG